MPRKIKQEKLTAAQIEIAGQFNDYAFENRSETMPVMTAFG